MTDTDWIALGSVAGVVAAAGTLAMAIAIIVTAIYTKGTLAAVRDDSRARTRPVMVAYLEREVLSHGAVLLLIRNFGQSVASDVRISFNPPAPSPGELAALEDSNMMKWLYQRFAQPVPTWAPGWVTSNVVRSGQDPMPALTVELLYGGPDGNSYVESFVLHPDHILKETTSNPSKTDDPVKLGQQAVAAMQALVRTSRTR